MSNYMPVSLFYESILRGGIALRRRNTARFLLLMIVSTIVMFGISFGVLQFRYSRGAEELKRIRAHRDELDLRVRDLNAELEYAQTDAYIMRAARDQLGLIMPGEVRYVNGSK